jgi:anti-anti-sigma factor
MRTREGGPRLEREDIGDVTVVRVRGLRYLVDEADPVFGPIQGLVADAGRSNLVLSLAPVLFLASVPFGKLVSLQRLAVAAGGRLALCELSPGVREILDVTWFSELLEIYPTEEEAVRSFATPPPLTALAGLLEEVLARHLPECLLGKLLLLAEAEGDVFEVSLPE